MLRMLVSAKFNTIKTIAAYFDNMFSFDCINPANTNGKHGIILHIYCGLYLKSG